MSPHLDTVGLVVQDMAKSLEFYRTLGLAIASQEDQAPHVEYQGAQGYTIGCISQAVVQQTDPKWIASFGQRLNLQFKFDAPTEVDAAHQRLVAEGYESYQEPWDSFWGQRFARVIDPDQNVVNLFATQENS